jgi:hypothetical protein
MQKALSLYNRIAHRVIIACGVRDEMLTNALRRFDYERVAFFLHNNQELTNEHKQLIANDYIYKHFLKEAIERNHVNIVKFLCTRKNSTIMLDFNDTMKRHDGILQMSLAVNERNGLALADDDHQNFIADMVTINKIINEKIINEKKIINDN